MEGSGQAALMALLAFQRKHGMRGKQEYEDKTWTVCSYYYYEGGNP